MSTAVAVKERPILFSGPMVRAILGGYKTQTRRILKPQPEYVWGFGVSRQDPEHFTAHVRYPGGHSPDPWVRSPYGRPPVQGQPGDRLWAREAWAVRARPDGLWVEYRAGGEPVPVPTHHDIRDESGKVDFARYALPADRWRPSIHMPRWASRITLEVTAVRVERLQGISEADAQAEGWDLSRLDLTHAPISMDTARVWFREYWNHINRPRGYGWTSNPWVWVVEFRRA